MDLMIQFDDFMKIFVLTAIVKIFTRNSSKFSVASRRFSY